MSKSRRFTSNQWGDFAVKLGRDGRGRSLAEFRGWLRVNEERCDEHFGRGQWTLWQAYGRMCETTEAPASGFPDADRREELRAEAESAVERASAPSNPSSGESVVIGEGAGDSASDSADADFDQRIAEYLAFYRDVSPNDMSTLKDLVWTEQNIARINALMRTETGKAYPDPVAIKNFSDSLARLSQQSRALQETLHIDRAAREREAQASSDADKALEVIDAAGAYAEEYGLPLTHQCATGRRGTIQFGFVLWDFPEVELAVTFECPLCKELVVVNRKPSAAEIAAATEPVWVAEEEVEYDQPDKQSKPIDTKGEASE